MKYWKKFKLIIAVILIASGAMLMVVNIIGLFIGVRPDLSDQSYFRFSDDIKYTYVQAIDSIDRKEDESAKSYIERVNNVISGALAHINWEEHDPDKFYQRVPVWENYILYLMSYLSGIPEFERYHFTNYKRSLERGIGICGDASMVLSQILQEQDIENEIITFPGHVVLEANTNGVSKLYDPDFGVIVPYSVVQVAAEPEKIHTYYKSAGASDKEINNLINIYKNEYETWSGVSHFMTNKYYFEMFAYLVKWPLPVLLILGGFILMKKARNNS